MPPSDFARREQDDGLKRTLRVRRKFLQVCFELKCLTEFSELTRKHFSPVSAHRIAQEEIFGSVLSVMTFRTPEEAFERANNTPYGLSAGVWTDKGSKIFKMVNKLRAGVVWANTFNKFDPTSPFGGYKESGFGREGGVQGLAAYCRLD